MPIYNRTTLRLTDTPGLELDAPHELEPGVSGLMSLLEGRFDERLREESRIVRQQKADDGMVHLGQ